MIRILSVLRRKSANVFPGRSPGSEANNRSC